MGNIMLLAAAAVLLVGWGVLIFTLASRGDTLHGADYGMCAPARYDSYTAAPPPAPRRIVAELAPPAGWREGELVAILAEPARVEYAGGDDGEDGDELDGWGDEPWLVAEDWPQQQVAAVEPVPMIVNRTAARFASLELGGGAR